MEARYAIAIASGHTNSLVGVFDRKSRSLFWRNSGSLSIHTVSKNASVQRIKSVLEGLRIDKVALLDATIVFCVPGISHINHRTKAQQLVEAALDIALSELKITFIDDTLATLIGELGTLNGICAFSGTGASVFCGLGLKNAPEVATRPSAKASGYFAQSGKIDGYGPILGDRGSGFRLGSDLLARALRQIEASGGRNKDLYMALARFDPDLRDPLNVQHWFDTLLEGHGAEPASEKSWAVRISQLATPIVALLKTETLSELNELSSRNPASAKAIAFDCLRRAVTELANSVRISLSQLPDTTNIPLICQGGMFRNSDHYFKLFQEELQQYAGPISRARWNPCVGALLLALTPEFEIPGNDAAMELHRRIDSSPDGGLARYPIDNRDS